MYLTVCVCVCVRCAGDAFVCLWRLEDSFGGSHFSHHVVLRLNSSF